MQHNCNTPQTYDVYGSGDYAGMSAGRYSFYVGYEATICPTHGKDADCGCDDQEWAFTASENGAEVGRIPLSRIGDAGDSMRELLLRGISRFGNKFWK